jgi:predicted nucleic acid-binding protein
VGLVRDAMEHGRAILPPVVVCEVLSDPLIPSALVDDIANLPVLDLLDGYWRRAGQLRALLIKRNHKAKLADVLVAQSCIDHHLPLVTFDRDFRHYTRSGLVLL